MQADPDAQVDAMLQPILAQIQRLEEEDRSKSAQISTLSLAIEKLKEMALEHKKKQDIEDAATKQKEAKDSKKPAKK
jgi:hypothetical protein